MKVNKLFGVKSITNLIYGLLLLAPFVAILSRVIYVQSNDYAKDSYYGETINEVLEIKFNYNELQTNETYFFENIITNNMTSDYGNETRIYVDNVINLNGFNNNIDLSNTNRIRLYLTTTYNALNFEDINGNIITSFNEFSNVGKFSFIYKGYIGNQQAISYYNYFYQTQYNKYSYLDNAFEYSLYTFVQDNDVQSIDFFSWFTNLFLNQNNTHNALYLNFANWYLNYTLLVSSGYLLFFALMWFINYVRKILEKSSYHDFGGF